MRLVKKIAYACYSLTFGLLALTSCTDGELYDVNAPDWISDKIQEIEDSKKQPEEEVLEGMQEDVYTIGNTDFTSSWWAAFSKYYVVPDGEKWNAVFNLHINPADNTYYKNFVLVITNDADRGGTEYTEYGAIRFDFAAALNSEWGDYIDRQYISSTLIFSPDESNIDANVQKLGGKVTLTVDRTSENAFTVKITNGEVTKIYKQPYKEENLNTDANNANIRCFLVTEGSYIDFLQTNIVPIGGLTSAEDKNPVSMVLQDIPDQVNVGTPLEEAMADVSAIITFEEGVTKTVPAAELTFSAIPDMEQPGVKTLVAIYNKTFKGENCDKPIMASTTFEAVEKIASIEVTTPPSHTRYYYYTSAATASLTDRTMVFDPTGLVVTATYTDGSTRTVDNARLSFSAVPAKAGSQSVTITAGKEVTATVEVTVFESTVSEVRNTANMVGAEDNSTGFGAAFSDYFSIPMGETKSITFTNYSNLVNFWNNFVVVLRKANYIDEYAFVRADNWGMGNGYDACVHSGTQGDLNTWLAGMNGAKVTVYVTNCGNGTADVQAVMEGTTGTTSTQYYLGINTVNPDDLHFALTVDGCHLVFNE
ncbi:bacterial Ig-like domain-containing protein [Bacteroides acidifaciens]|uniref:bacterial Ig-like domain-containing protein n=1 Tax=Bacteroides acidifaciens TaxID=85831 RepID=UPI002149D16E|nr:bacterial Ig-like domain-containing protein [Bacteroides acidifaciens]MCR2004266.1 bacterial Ig-like domain-containing protein [Bacteroides acidifaciens]